MAYQIDHMRGKEGGGSRGSPAPLPLTGKFKNLLNSHIEFTKSRL